MKYPILELMKEKGAPLTREEYLRWAFLGNPPVELDPEEEAMLPPQFRPGSCTVFVKPPNSPMMIAAENVTVELVEEWFCLHAPELRAQGIKIWVYLPLSDDPEDEMKQRMFICELCGIECSNDCFLLPDGGLLCPPCNKDFSERDSHRNQEA